MGQVNQESNILNRLIKVEQELAALRKSSGLASARVGRGGITVVDASNNERVFMGETSAFEATPQPVFFVRDQSGNLRLAMYDPTPTGYQPVVWIFDHLGHVAFTTDVNGGVAEPWIAIPGVRRFTPSSGSHDIAAVVATLPASALAVSSQVWIGQIGKVSHPRIQLRLTQGRATGVSATPTYTFRVNGVSVDSWTDAAFAEVTRTAVDISSLLGTLNVTVDLLVSATGTGTDRIAADVTGVYLRQT